MNWIFEAYSNVYNAAMMQSREQPVYPARAKASEESHTGTIARFFGRG
jgi:hypothetical protein